MMATFIGYRVDGLAGAFAATLGVFLMPWLVATSAAWLVRSFLESRWLRAFGAGAGASVVGLQVVTAADLARNAFTNWGFVAVAVVALGLSLLTKIHPLVILAGGAVVGALMS
jgi:chromate transporter